MDEEVFNMQVRKFLKKVGITAQQEIERAVRAALEAGELGGDETLQASVTLDVPSLALRVEIGDAIRLE
ncbi:MAG TPA: DUF6494 family protein [Gammaproteobacteria bacterium]|nr:DUF6494 family protein [Gammaproteobacteria bacterium]